MDRPLKIVAADSINSLTRYGGGATYDADLVVVPKTGVFRSAWGMAAMVHGPSGLWGTREPVAVAWGADPAKVLGLLQGTGRPRKVAILTRAPTEAQLAMLEPHAFPMVVRPRSVTICTIGRSRVRGEVAELLHGAP